MFPLTCGEVFQSQRECGGGRLQGKPGPGSRTGATEEFDLRRRCNWKVELLSPKITSGDLQFEKRSCRVRPSVLGQTRDNEPVQLFLNEEQHSQTDDQDRKQSTRRVACS